MLGPNKLFRGTSSTKVTSVHIAAKKDTDQHKSKDRDTGPRRAEQARKHSPLAKASGQQLFVLLRRFLILIAALYYVAISIQCCVTSGRILVGSDQMCDVIPYTSTLVGAALGNATVQESVLMQTLLNGDTSPRQSTLYLFATEDNDLQLSLESCPTPSAVDAVYTDTFLRTMFAALVHGTSYNLTFLDPTISELIAPLVDCTSAARILEDFTAGRFFFLLRDKSDSTAISLVVINLSNQGFQAVARNEMGSASVMSLAVLTNMVAPSVDHHFVLSLGYPFQQFDMVVYEWLSTTKDNNWELRSLPRDKSVQSPRTLRTACRSGFYIETESSQSLSVNSVWGLDADPQSVASVMPWYGSIVSRDSWAWVHFIHGFLAWGVLFQVLVLLVITIRNVRVRKFWIGDAFVGISSSLEVRGIIVVVSMVMNKFWTIKVFCLRDVLIMTTATASVEEPISHADLLAIYLSLVGLLGKVLRVRVDPALSVGMFELGFQLRTKIRAWVPSVTAFVANVGLQDFAAGIVTSADESSAISPMLLWGTHTMIPLPFSFFLGILFPILITMIPVAILVLVRKAIQRWFPISQSSRSHISQGAGSTLHSNRSDASERARDQHELYNSSLRTNFELATGARLADQYGLVGDYDNYKYIKGLRFASADGIYSNGFVIVNHKFLVQTSDLLTIAMMILFQVRFRNVYAYEIDEHSVGELARLVYPDTMTFADLLCIDINVLT